jgi:aspartate 1-decarboxylase
MQRMMMRAKIHRARVTSADLHYMGSITIDRALMDAVGLIPFEQVQVLNLENGARIETYVIEGPAGSGQIQINGAAAHLFAKQHKIIIIAYALVDDSELEDFSPRVAFVDEHNRLRQVARHAAGGGDPEEKPLPGE